MSWVARALCAEVDPELWYSPDAKDREEAKRICGNCPVRNECLEDALTQEAGAPVHHRFGIHGGLDEEERARLAKGAA